MIYKAKIIISLLFPTFTIQCMSWDVAITKSRSGSFIENNEKNQTLKKTGSFIRRMSILSLEIQVAITKEQFNQAKKECYIATTKVACSAVRECLQIYDKSNKMSALHRAQRILNEVNNYYEWQLDFTEYPNEIRDELFNTRKAIGIRLWNDDLQQGFCSYNYWAFDCSKSEFLKMFNKEKEGT